MVADKFQVSHKKGSVETKMAHFHHHDCFELFYFLGNEMSYFIENKTYQLKQYDLVFIDKYTYHKSKYSANSSRERMVIMFDESILNMINNTEIQQKIKQLFINRKISFSQKLDKIILETFTNRLLPSYNSIDSAAGLIKAQFVLLEILLTIIDWIDKGNASVGETAVTTAKEKHIYDIISHINHNFSSGITLDSLASRFFINKYYLCHTFKEITGTSVIAYINRKRLIEAEKLLKCSDMSITEVSSSVGYNNVSYFISLFNKRYGCTPYGLKNKSRK